MQRFIISALKENQILFQARCIWYLELKGSWCFCLVSIGMFLAH